MCLLHFQVSSVLSRIMNSALFVVSLYIRVSFLVAVVSRFSALPPGKSGGVCLLSMVLPGSLFIVF